MNFESEILNPEPNNILIIHFGQLGDVVLGLPALRAIAGKFPGAKITALVGKSAAEIVGISELFEEIIVVDRVELRDGKKFSSIGKILKIVGDIRRRKFDFVIDLHSLPETNLLGFLSGAKSRLYANRESRSLDRLARFPAKPPLEDKAKHLTERYLDVLLPLGIETAQREIVIEPQTKDRNFVAELFKKNNLENAKLAGLFPGAGNPSRRWSLENFAELARLLIEKDDVQPLVFLGPEEHGWREQVAKIFPPETVIIEKLNLAQLIAALARLDVLVSNDTGVAHLGALAGAPLVIVMEQAAPLEFLPLSSKLEIVNSGKIDEISVNEVYGAARKFLK